MQKTKLGVSVGLLGAAIYFLGLFSGYLVATLLTAYVLLFEDNEWLKKTAVKAISLLICFSLITVVIKFIPNILSIIDDIFSMFGGDFHIPLISNFINAVIGVIEIFEKILFIALGMKAVHQETITIPIVDTLIQIYTE